MLTREKIELRALQTTAREVRRSRSLVQQQAIARSGENPRTGAWWPSWVTWEHMTDPVRAILTRFNKRDGRAQFWGKVGGQAKSPAKTAAARQNARKPDRPSTLRARQVREATTLIPVSRRIPSGPVSSAEPQERGR
jgi:hypothetical protein